MVLLLFHLEPSFWPQRTGLAPSLPSISSQSSEIISYQLIPGNHQLRQLVSALLFCFQEGLEFLKAEEEPEL